MNSFDFRKSAGSIGKDKLPNQVHMVKSAFVKDRPQTLAKSKQICLAAGYDPKQGQLSSKPPKSLLYLRCNKDPIEMENEYFGPARMSTESQARFSNQPIVMKDLSTCVVGPKEESGFTNALNNEPITFREDSCFENGVQAKERPLGTSHMKGSFQPTRNANGNESYRLLSQRAAAQNGYTRSMKPRPEYASHRLATYTKVKDIHPLRLENIKKNDNGEYFNLLYSDPFPSMTSAAFGDQTSVEKSSKHHQRKVGFKEDTGFTENNCKFIPSAETKESLKRFDTHYKQRFYDKNRKLINDSFAKIRDTLPHKDNGFVKSTCVHSHGNEIDVRTLRLDPYEARSLRSRDPSYTA